MRIVTPEEFKKAFLTVVTLHEPKLVECWNNKKPYTTAIYEILEPIASELGIQVYAGNYYYLDAVFYETKNTTDFSPTTTYVDFISVAFEHENEDHGTATEINKLQLFNASLKVLVTYCWGEQNVKQNLDKYARLIAKADGFEDISTKRRQLVIFGTCNKDKRACWSFHVYDNKQFREI